MLYIVLVNETTQISHILTEFRNSMAFGKMRLRTLQHDKNNTCAAGTGVE